MEMNKKDLVDYLQSIRRDLKNPDLREQNEMFTAEMLDNLLFALINYFGRKTGV